MGFGSFCFKILQPESLNKYMVHPSSNTELLNFDNVDIDAMFDEVKKKPRAQSLVYFI